MSERLRELARRFQESGTVEDHAAWLRERSRVGELSPEALKVAAWVGNAAARLVLESEAPAVIWPFFKNQRDLALLKQTLPRPLRLRIALAAAHHALGRSPHASDETLLAEGERYLLDELTGTPELPPRSQDGVIGAHLRSVLLSDQILNLRLLVWACGKKPEVYAAVERELSQWALGPSDPVRVRAGGR